MPGSENSTGSENFAIWKLNIMLNLLSEIRFL